MPAELSNVKPVTLADLDAGARYDLVAVLRSGSGRAGPVWQGKDLASRVAEGGYLYVEVDRPALLLPTALWRLYLKRQGFEEVDVYWPRPNFNRLESLMPLDERRWQRYYLEQFFYRSSFKRRMAYYLLGAAVKLGVFELALPCYCLLARRSGKAGVNA